MTGVQGHDLDYYFYSLSKYHTALMTNIVPGPGPHSDVLNIVADWCVVTRRRSRGEVTKLM